MKRVTTTALTAILLATTMTAQIQLREDNIDEVLKAMTLEEKAQLLVGGGNAGFVGSGAMLGHQEKLVAGAAGITVAIPRLGIPATVLCDGPAGVHIDAKRKGDSQTYYATGFPVGTCLASTWNTELVEQVGQAIGNETLEYGCDVILGPGLNLHRSVVAYHTFIECFQAPLAQSKVLPYLIVGLDESVSEVRVNGVGGYLPCKLLIRIPFTSRFCSHSDVDTLACSMLQ